MRKLPCVRASLRPDRGRQFRHFAEADAAHYRWQTNGGYFAETERALIDAAGLPAHGRLLEVGCGEGGNLFHLGARPGWAGADFAAAKLRQARATLPGLLFVCADAAWLPLRDSRFDGVLIRDLLHHVPERVAVLRDALRVLRPGGVLAVVEPNRASPLIMAQALLVPAERAVLRSHARRIETEMRRAGLADVTVARAQPLPLARLLHPRLGLDRLGRRAVVARLLRALDAGAARLVPRAAWMYLVGRGRKRG